LDLVAFPYLAKGKDLRESERLALDNMARVGLRAVAERPFRSLSGGEAQRLMLARAMSIKPDLLLIDEPTAQLDRQTASTVNDAIQGLTMDGTITVIATHDSNTRQACDDVIDLALYAE
jgi:ABC-type lipoprotein export system ATPase subunit